MPEKPALLGIGEASFFNFVNTNAPNLLKAYNIVLVELMLPHVCKAFILVTTGVLLRPRVDRQQHRVVIDEFD